MVVSQAETVLVVEDDDSMRQALERFLRAAGFECVTFSSADALLARGVDQDLVCVISDLRLPGMSGLELLGALHERNQTTPFILVTAHDAPGLREKAMLCGAAAYLAKPFRGTALLEAIKAATAT